MRKLRNEEMRKKLESGCQL